MSELDQIAELALVRCAECAGTSYAHLMSIGCLFAVMAVHCKRCCRVTVHKWSEPTSMVDERREGN